MEIRKDLKYTKTHEWVRLQDGLAYVGISAVACEQLGELVYIDLPKTGSVVKQGDEVCTVESVKAASPLFAPVSGTITGVSAELEDAPEQIQSDPYGKHIFVIRLSDESELDALLDADAYQAEAGE